MNCHQCGEEIELDGKVMRKDDCPSCHASLHACLNCAFHDRAAHNQCREPAAEWVSSKEAANFCEFFQPATASGGKPARSRTQRDAFEDLFKKP